MSLPERFQLKVFFHKIAACDFAGTLPPNEATLEATQGEILSQSPTDATSGR